MKKQNIVIGAALAMLIAFVVGAAWFQGAETERIVEIAQDSSSTLRPDHAMVHGPDNAKVQIVEFFDPACETCARFYGPVKELVDAHPGQIQLVLRYAPFHPGSDKVVKILEAARLQGKYWETLEILFASQSVWASHHEPRPDLIWQILPKVGVDVERIRVDMAGFALDALVQQDIEDAATLGIRKTPGYLVNGKPLPSFGFPQLQALVESELATHY